MVLKGPAPSSLWLTGSRLGHRDERRVLMSTAGERSTQREVPEEPASVPLPGLQTQSGAGSRPWTWTQPPRSCTWDPSRGPRYVVNSFVEMASVHHEGHSPRACRSAVFHAFATSYGYRHLFQNILIISEETLSICSQALRRPGQHGTASVCVNSPVLRILQDWNPTHLAFHGVWCLQGLHCGRCQSFVPFRD